MSNRFKVIQVASAEAEETADALSQLIDQKEIKSFHQLFVHGHSCFTVEFL
jgi:hypothetical protein